MAYDIVVLTVDKTAALPEQLSRPFPTAISPPHFVAKEEVVLSAVG
jgi:hypothetical protein